MATFRKRNQPLSIRNSSRRSFNSARSHAKVTKPKLVATGASVPNKATSDPLQATLPVIHEPFDEIEALNKKIENYSESKETEAVYGENSYIPSFSPDPDDFNGVDDDDEHFKLMSNEVRSEQRRAKELEDRLHLIQQEYDQERLKLTQTIHELKHELMRTKPLHDNALFSLTRDLRDTAQQMEVLMQSANIPLTTTPPVYEKLCN